MVLTRDRLMGIGQAITMPLFFASNALYPVELMPAWVQLLSRVNPLSYEVSALRGLLIGMPTNYWLDFGVLIGAALLGIAVASALLGEACPDSRVGSRSHERLLQCPPQIGLADLADAGDRERVDEHAPGRGSCRRPGRARAVRERLESGAARRAPVGTTKAQLRSPR